MNTIFVKSVDSDKRYNPFTYVNDDVDVRIMVDCISRHGGLDPRQGDPFFINAEIALLRALCYYAYHQCPKEEQNFDTIINMLAQCIQPGRDVHQVCELDEMFIKLAEQNPDHIAVKDYYLSKRVAGTSWLGVLHSLLIRLYSFKLYGNQFADAETKEALLRLNDDICSEQLRFNLRRM